MNRLQEGYDWIPPGQPSSGTLNYLLAADNIYWAGETFPWRTLSGQFAGSALGIGGDIFPNSQKSPIAHLTGVSVSSGTIGARMYRGSSDTADPTLMAFDASNAGGQVSISLCAFGVIKVWRGQPWSGVLLAASAPGAFFMDNVFELEFSFTISATVGTVEVKVNAGVPTHLTGIVINITNVNTQGTASLTSDSVGQGYDCHGGGTVLSTGPNFDDIYMNDTAGAVNTGFLGNVRSQQLKTAGAGAHTALSFTGAASNWQAVQRWQLDDGSYVYTPNTGDYDLYTVSPMVNTGPVFAVQVRGAMRQDDATEIEGQNLLYSGGVQGTTTPRLMSETYAFYIDILETDPNTGLGWLAANVNAVEIGITKAA